MNKENNKKKNVKQLKDGYRLIIYNDSTFQTVWSTRLTSFNGLIIIGSVSLFLILLTVLVIAYTPARELIPGYPTSDVRNQIVRNAMLVDSLDHQIKIRDEYFGKIKAIIQGDTPAEPDYIADTEIRPVEINFDSFNHDSVFRQSLLQEQLGLSLQQSEVKQSYISNVLFFSPLQGMISQKFDKNIDHFAVDIVGLPNSRIAAVQKGTVIFAGWTPDTGYVLYIQHDNNLTSVYKHNAELLKKVGDPVVAGEVIAFMGNTGELTTGPHLHFELWYKGIPVNPEDYIDF